MSDVPLGVLLSGGLDSSLIASITNRIMNKKGQELHSFSVGLDPGAPDMMAARRVAAFLGTNHHEVFFSVEEGLGELKKVIWNIETYDVTTVRAATPMYFLSRYISSMGIKVVLSGEGADEIFGGYLYFHNAPSAIEFQKEVIRRVSLLSTADCLRADKSTMAHGLEARVPFLDRSFLDVVMPFKPEDKQPNAGLGRPEKYILRSAFHDPEHPFLPEDILWRQKEQFGDGVGYGWIDGVIEYSNHMVSDHEMAQAARLYPYNTPDTKEAFLFRKLYEESFPEEHAIKTVLKWIPRWQKNQDPSGRVAEKHMQSVDDLQNRIRLVG
jgi:asparagine synthase (glutamine-hydrolysing)